MDEAKNMALLFFLDHMMQKGGKRTIHDLSCQFGARGFTQEMRDAVGTTQEGLTDFLSQFPSLFSLDGDQVSLRGFGELDGKNTLAQLPRHNQRNYEQEAVEFFVTKLHKFGPELQIKSLLGHRSQAAPEVRLISGRHLKEFVEFLQSQTEDFIVEGDRVRLKHMPEPKGEQLVPEVVVDDEGQPLTGVKAKQAAVEYLRGVLESNEDVPMPLECFYRKFCDRFPHSVRQEVATNPKELLQFLKLNRNIFFIRSNKVSLVKVKPEGVTDVSGTLENGSENSDSCPISPLSPLFAGGGEVDAGGGSPTRANVLFPLNRNNLHRVQLVKSLNQANEVVSNFRTDLEQMTSEGGEKWIAVDFKLITIGGGGTVGGQFGNEEFLSMGVVASRNRLAVFDLAHSDSLLLESGLKQLLESPTCLKVMHEVRRASALLAQRYSVHLRNVFDTQIAHSVIQHDKFNKPLAELRFISFVNLQRVYHPHSLMMSDMSPRKMSQTPNWGERPITDQMLLNASEECHCLVSALYPSIMAQFPVAHRQLFEDKCQEALLAHGASRPPHSAPPYSLHPAPPSPLLSPFLGSRGFGDLNGGGIYRPPATRRGFSFGNRMQLMSQPLFETPQQQSQSQPHLQPLIPGLVSHHHHHSNGGTNGQGGEGGTLRKSSAPLMNVPYRPLAQLYQPSAHHHSISTLIGGGGKLKPRMVDSETQTISTGDITVLKVYYEGDE